MTKKKGGKQGPRDDAPVPSSIENHPGNERATPGDQRQRKAHEGFLQRWDIVQSVIAAGIGLAVVMAIRTPINNNTTAIRENNKLLHDHGSKLATANTLVREQEKKLNELTGKAKDIPQLNANMKALESSVDQLEETRKELALLSGKLEGKLAGYSERIDLALRQIAKRDEEFKAMAQKTDRRFADISAALKALSKTQEQQGAVLDKLRSERGPSGVSRVVRLKLRKPTSENPASGAPGAIELVYSIESAVFRSWSAATPERVSIVSAHIPGEKDAVMDNIVVGVKSFDEARLLLTVVTEKPKTVRAAEIVVDVEFNVVK